MMIRFFLSLVLLLTSAALLRADGGMVILRERGDQGEAVLFVAPNPLRAGPADFSVLLTDAEGQPRLAEEVRIALREPTESGESVTPACCRIESPPPMQDLTGELGVGGNKLLYEARTRLPKSGTWEVTVTWQNPDGKPAFMSGTFEVGPPPRVLAAYWPWFLIPLVGALFLSLNAAARAARAIRR